MTFQTIYISLQNLWNISHLPRYNVFLLIERKINFLKAPNLIKSFHLKAAASTVTFKLVGRARARSYFCILIDPVVFDHRYIFSGFGEVIWQKMLVGLEVRLARHSVSWSWAVSECSAWCHMNITCAAALTTLCIGRPNSRHFRDVAISIYTWFLRAIRWSQRGNLFSVPVCALMLLP